MRPIRWARRGLALLGAGALGGAAIITARHIIDTPQPLGSGLPGEGGIDDSHGGEIYYTVAGPAEARPIVLLHDFYPGASSYEYSSLVPRLARANRVYAPDWLGFAMSEHPPLTYTGEFYANTLAGYLRDVVGRPATVIASGRAANIAARAASDTPALFDRLVLVSPNIAAGVRLDPTVAQTLVRLMERVSLGIVPYALLSSRPLVRLLAMRRGMGAATEDALDHQWSVAHQFGAQYAALAELTGELDLPVRHVLPLLQPPLLLVAGEDDPQRPRAAMEELAILTPYADLDMLPGAGSAVCQDQPARFVAALTAWMQREIPRHVSTDTLRVSSPLATAGASGRDGAVTRSTPGALSALRVAPSAEARGSQASASSPSRTPGAAPSPRPDAAPSSPPNGRQSTAPRSPAGARPSIAAPDAGGASAKPSAAKTKPGAKRAGATNGGGARSRNTDASAGSNQRSENKPPRNAERRGRTPEQEA